MPDVSSPSYLVSSPFAFGMSNSPTPGLQGSTSVNSSPFTTTGSLPLSRHVSLAFPTPSRRHSEESDDIEMHEDPHHPVKVESRRGSSAGLRSYVAWPHFFKLLMLT